MHIGNIRAVSLGSLLAVIGTAMAMAQGPAQHGSNEPTAARSQAAQESLIELHFAEDETLSGRGLEASVKGDTTTLSGTVKSPEDRDRAERLARTAGARVVDNQLQIEVPPAKPAKGSNEPMTTEERLRRRGQASPAQRDPPAATPPSSDAPAAEQRQ